MYVLHQNRRNMETIIICSWGSVVTIFYSYFLILPLFFTTKDWVVKNVFVFIDTIRYQKMFCILWYRTFGIKKCFVFFGTEHSVSKNDFLFFTTEHWVVKTCFCILWYQTIGIEEWFFILSKILHFSKSVSRGFEPPIFRFRSQYHNHYTTK